MNRINLSITKQSETQTLTKGKIEVNQLVKVRPQKEILLLAHRGN